MTNSEFISLVERMRTAQKAYFRRRTPEALQTSKELEREVDRVIEEGKNKTGKLFGKED